MKHLAVSFHKQLSCLWVVADILTSTQPENSFIFSHWEKNLLIPQSLIKNISPPNFKHKSGKKRLCPKLFLKTSVSAVRPSLNDEKICPASPVLPSIVKVTFSSQKPLTT